MTNLLEDLLTTLWRPVVTRQGIEVDGVGERPPGLVREGRIPLCAAAIAIFRGIRTDGAARLPDPSKSHQERLGE